MAENNNEPKNDNSEVLNAIKQGFADMNKNISDNAPKQTTTNNNDSGILDAINKGFSDLKGIMSTKTKEENNNEPPQQKAVVPEIPPKKPELDDKPKKKSFLERFLIGG